jgi:hypothetical protein
MHENGKNEWIRQRRHQLMRGGGCRAMSGLSYRRTRRRLLQGKASRRKPAARVPVDGADSVRLSPPAARQPFGPHGQALGQIGEMLLLAAQHDAVSSVEGIAFEAIDASGVDRIQIRRFLKLPLVERLAWLDADDAGAARTTSGEKVTPYQETRPSAALRAQGSPCARCRWRRRRSRDFDRSTTSGSSPSRGAAW